LGKETPRPRHSREGGNPYSVDYEHNDDRTHILPHTQVMKNPCVYILASKPNGTLYIGVTSDVMRRVWEHKNDVVEGFTKQHQVYQLVYAEFLETMDAAILREKQMKKWRRAWKINLIQNQNPSWRDLYEELLV